MITLLLALPLCWINAADVDPASLREAAELARQTAATIRLDNGDVRRSRDVGSIVLSVDGALRADASLELHRVRIEQVSEPQLPDCRERCSPVEPLKTIRRAYEFDAEGNLLFVQDSADLVVPKIEVLVDPQLTQRAAEIIAETMAAFHVDSWTALVEKSRREGHRGPHSAGEIYALTSDNASAELSLQNRGCRSVSIRVSRAPGAEAGNEGEVWQLCADDAGNPTGLGRIYTRLDDQTVRNDNPSATDRQYAARLLRYWLNRSRPF